MSDIERSKIVNEEAQFSLDELFFSRTDKRGVILSGNCVFQKISQYSWAELLNKPHNIIRHPDMPKAVFWLLWNTIKKGEPIGAYVKNRAKDGRYYWVFAIVTPIEEGYLSVRIKPCNPKLLAIVDQEYKDLILREKKDKLTMEESGSILLARLAELGYKQYSHFMATALANETKKRDELLGREEDIIIENFYNLIAEAKTLLQQSECIFSAYESSKYVPLNLRIQAAQLGQAGSTIAVISSNYNIMSTEIKTCLQKFIELTGSVFDTINKGLFLSCTAKIQKEVCEVFRNEDSEGPINKDQEMLYLEEQQKIYQQKALDGLGEIYKQVKNFEQSFLEMKKLSTGLETIRIMGKVESSRLVTSESSLFGLINDLAVFQSSVNECLKKIDNVNKQIHSNITILLTQNKKFGS